MTSFSIIGTGNMATAISGVLRAGGSAVDLVPHEEVGTRDLTGDVVVLAVPYPAVDSVLTAYGDALAGRTVVDITNPLNFETFDSLVVPVGSPAASEIQDKLPRSHVLKAFNTNFAATLSSGTVGEERTTVLIAGDDEQAKATLAAAVEAGGLGAVDAGSLARAHELEALGFLQLTLAAGEKISWTGGFAVVH